MQDVLLQAALSPHADPQCKAIVEMAASVGVMYLSTMARDLTAPPLVMLATLLNNNSNLLMVENLMAAVWILLRNSHNRKILSTAFNENPVLSATLKGQMQACPGRLPDSSRILSSSRHVLLPSSRDSV
jgi:hypothetical protein